MITALYALPLVALYMWLALRVVNYRKSHKVSLGDGGSDDLLARIRTHGNLGEYAPLGLVMLLLAELSGVSPVLVHVAGVALVAGRFLHAWALGLGGPFQARVAGMALTFASLALCALAAAIATLS